MRHIQDIANEIARDWKKPYFGAVPYLQAMIRADFGYDGEHSIVSYFLCNAGTWRGEVARRIKKELKERKY